MALQTFRHIGNILASAHLTLYTQCKEERHRNISWEKLKSSKFCPIGQCISPQILLSRMRAKITGTSHIFVAEQRAVYGGRNSPHTDLQARGPLDFFS